MKKLTVEELKQKLDSGEKFTLIDCREPQEYEEANLGGRLIPLGKFQTMDLDELEDAKDDEIVVHCRSGKRSLMACTILEQMGFSNVANLEGGILDWIEKYGQTQ